MRVGIYGGSFSPIHNAHVALGRSLVQQGAVDELWYMVSPHNPLKERRALWNDELRLQLVQLALSEEKGLKACDFEFSLPRPSYMLTTLNALAEKYPEHRFVLVIGADNWQVFDRWYRSREIIERYGVIVYPRPGYETDATSLPPGVSLVETPLMDISSTWIREQLQREDYDGCGLPDIVWQKIKNDETLSN